MRKNKTHYRRFKVQTWSLFVLTLPLLTVLSLLFSDCGGGAAPSPTTSYLSSDTQTLELIDWQPTTTSSSDTAIGGQWTRLSASDPLADPVASTNSFTGNVWQQQVTVDLGGLTVDGTLHTETLSLPVPSFSGQRELQTWYAGSMGDYNVLATAFVAFHQVHAALYRLDALVQSPPVDSDASSYDRSVQTAHQYVSTLQAQEQTIRSSAHPCDSTGIFDELYPPDASLFRLTPSLTAEQALAHTELATQLNVVQNAWQRASVLPLPDVPGLPRSWVMNAQEEQQAVAAGQHLLLALNATLRLDYAQMNVLHGQSQRIGQEVEQIRKLHGCAS